jgi:hypothetical protein
MILLNFTPLLRFQVALQGSQTLITPDFWIYPASPTYTPRSGNVFDSLDREAERIGWSGMLKRGRIRGIRKTEDGRYAIAYSVPRKGQRDHRYLIASYIHLSTGYPAIRFLPDLQAYRATTGDFKSVVNAYESHDHVYQTLERQGGTVIVRGRGIVASRILQRLNRHLQKTETLTVTKLQGKFLSELFPPQKRSDQVLRNLKPKVHQKND